MTAAQILGELLLGWLLADLVGGLVHWWEDRVARSDTPVIGPLVIAPNRLHHSDPLAFTRSSLLERNFATWSVVAAISAPTSFAVQLAENMGVTLAGFMRDQSYVVYTHPERLTNSGVSV